MLVLQVDSPWFETLHCKISVDQYKLVPGQQQKFHRLQPGLCAAPQLVRTYPKKLPRETVHPHSSLGCAKPPLGDFFFGYKPSEPRPLYLHSGRSCSGKLIPCLGLSSYRLERGSEPFWKLKMLVGGKVPLSVLQSTALLPSTPIPFPPHPSLLSPVPYPHIFLQSYPSASLHPSPLLPSLHPPLFLYSTLSVSLHPTPLIPFIPPPSFLPSTPLLCFPSHHPPTSLQPTPNRSVLWIRALRPAGLQRSPGTLRRGSREATPALTCQAQRQSPHPTDQTPSL